MHSIKIVILIVTLIVTNACAFAHAQRSQLANGKSQIGGLIFTPPVGWQPSNQNGLTMFTAPGGQCGLIIFPGQNTNDDFDFESWAKALAVQARNGGKLIKGGDVTRTSINGTTVLSIAEVIDSAKGQRSYRLYLAAHPGSRAEFVAYFATTPEQFQQHQAELQTFIASIQFASPSSAGNGATSAIGHNTSLPAPPAGQFSGLYVSQTTDNSFNSQTGYYNNSTGYLYYFFWPDGHFYLGYPPDGNQVDFTVARAAKLNRNYTGTYQLANGKIILHFTGNSTPTVYPFSAHRDGGFSLNGYDFTRVNGTDSLQLDGLYGNTSYAAASGVGGDHYIAFTRDGHFKQRGFTGIAVSGGTASSQTAGQGTYQVSGTTIDLLYDNGHREKAICFLYPGEGNKLLMVNGAMYLRR